MALKTVFDNFLVPKHEIVPEEKVQELLDRFGFDTSTFPKISVEDPAAMEIMAKKGDVIRITRKSPTAGESYYFRVVI